MDDNKITPNTPETENTPINPAQADESLNLSAAETASSTSQQADNAAAENAEASDSAAGPARKPKLTKEERKEKAKKKKQDKIGKTRPKNTRAAAARLFSYVKPYKGRTIVSTLIALISTGASILATILMRPIFDNINGAITRTIATDTAISKITQSLILYALIYAGTSVLSFLYQKMMMVVAQRVMNSIRRDLFDHLQDLPLGFFDTHKTGDVMSRFNSDVESVNNLVSSVFISLLTSCLTLIMDLTLMIIYSWRITLTLTVTLLLMVIVVALITSRSSKLFKKQHKINGEFNGYVEEYIRGFKCVKVFNYEEAAKEGYAKINKEYRDTAVKASVISGLMGPLLSLITRANYAISTGIGAYQIVRGGGVGPAGLTVGKLIVYIQYSQNFGTPIASIAGQYNSLLAALAGAERVFDVIDTPHEVDDGKVTLVNTRKNSMGEIEECEEKTDTWSWKVPSDDGSVKYIPVRGEIEFKNVSFYYKEGEPVLKNLCLRANAGDKLAFVGSTGAGKTTITNLINRFYDVQEGSIIYDGINVVDIKKDDLRHSLSMVLQDTRLFSGTIAENIGYGRLDATKEDIIAAAKIANAHDFIEKLPDGYETELRTDGHNISAGQRQLLSIARAAVADSPVLILDEATSSVDTRTERLIELGMDGIMKNRTVFVIAHRLSTVRNSNDIIVLEHGEIIEEGNHADLIELGEKYYQLYTGKFNLS